MNVLGNTGLAALVGLAWIASQPLDAAEASPRRDATVQAVARAMPCVVNIATRSVVATRDPWDRLFREFFDPYYRQRPPDTQYSLGSGVIIDEEGFILTNDHVVARAGQIWVKLTDGRELEAERIVTATLTDLALLKIKKSNDEKFPAIQFAADDDLLLGETLLALGNPFGLGISVSRGILSSKSRRPPRENEPLDVPDWLQTDAAINPGNSGGPLINLDGEMIGINVAIYREAQGIGFAIPIKRISAALAEVYSPESLESLWFGARVQPGALPLEIIAVQADSPADRAGLLPGDRILEINGQPPRGFFHFNRQLLESKDKKEVQLRIRRAQKEQTVTLQLRPENEFFNADLIRRKTGLTLQELNPPLARHLGFAIGQGLLVADVEENSPAQAAHLAEGMLLTTLAGQPVSTVVGAAKVLHDTKPGATVELGLILRRARGVFLELREATVSLEVR